VGAAWSLTGLGMAYGGLRQFDLAVDRFGEALTRHAEVGSWFGEGGTRLFLSDILRSAGQYEASLAAARRAFELMDSHDAVHGKAMALVSIGWAQCKLGQRVESRDSFRHALSFLRVLGDRKSLAEALHGLGETSVGQPDVARTHLLEALTIYEDYDHPLTPEVRARLHELAQ
jgi:tetratricopeptide (TPR) repeat protein